MLKTKEKTDKYYLEFLQELFPWCDNEVLRDFSKTGHKKLFQKIWDENKFDWKRFSPILFSKFLDYLKIWWNPNKINWMKCTDILRKCYIILYDKYNIILDSNWFEYYDQNLLNVFWYYIFKNEIKFEDIWDPTKIDWNCRNTMYLLTEHNLNLWWDPDRFNWDKFSDLLPECYADDFNIWWDSDKFKFTPLSLEYLCLKLPHKYQIWFIPNKVKILSNEELRGRFTTCTSIPFDEWFDPKYDFDIDKLIFREKLEEFDKWFPYLKHKITLEHLFKLITHLPGRYNVWIKLFEDKQDEISSFSKLMLIQFDSKWKELFKEDCKNNPKILQDITITKIVNIIEQHDDLIMYIFSSKQNIDIFLEKGIYRSFNPTTLIKLLDVIKKYDIDIFKKILKHTSAKFFNYHISYLIEQDMDDLWLDNLKMHLESIDGFHDHIFIMLCRIMELDPSLFRILMKNDSNLLKFSKCLSSIPSTFFNDLDSIMRQFKQGIKSLGKENIDLWFKPEFIFVSAQENDRDYILHPKIFKAICETFPDPDIVKKILFFEFDKQYFDSRIDFESRSIYVNYILKYVDIFSDQELLNYVRHTSGFYGMLKDIPIEKIKALRAMDLLERTNSWKD